MIGLALGLFLFLGMHSAQMYFVKQRNAFIAQRGERTWKGVYSLIALLGLFLVVWNYGQARFSDWNIAFYPMQNWAVHLATPLMWISFVLLVASQLPAGWIKATVKHPMILAVKIWAVAHLLANGDLTPYILFGSFLIWAVLNRVSVEQRGATVFKTVSIRNDIVAGVGGSVFFVIVFVWAHLYLFGVAPWPG